MSATGMALAAGCSPEWTEESTEQLNASLESSLTGPSSEPCTQKRKRPLTKEKTEQEQEEHVDQVVAVARVPASIDCGPGLVLYIKTSNPYLRKLYSQMSQAHAGDSGVDLYCPEDISIKCGETKRIDLGIACEMRLNGAPQSFYMHPRSSLSKTPLMLANCAGVIDAGYRGNLLSALKYVPTTDDLWQFALFGSRFARGIREPASEFIARYDKHVARYDIKKGQRLVQICGPNLMPIRVVLCDALTTTTRGDKGFGSTGK